MFFTQEDYKNIEQWLQRNSVKDTEFQEALPAKGNEWMVITQDGYNRKVRLVDFIKLIQELGVQDFINVTDNYNARNITLEEAIKLIPYRSRKEGQVITFLNEENNWEIYQFQGVLNQWNITELWINVISPVIENESYLPDEEDLTLKDSVEGQVISLKDREYDKNNFSGLGHVILRKNIINIVRNVIPEEYVEVESLSNDSSVIVLEEKAPAYRYSAPYGNVKENSTYVIELNTAINKIYAKHNNGNCYAYWDSLELFVEESSTGAPVRNRYYGYMSSNGTYEYYRWNGSAFVQDTEKVTINKFAPAKRNSIQEIRYDFDLNGEFIQLRDKNNTILYFNGGSLNNGSIGVELTTRIIGTPRFNKVKFRGDYSNLTSTYNFNLLWFGENQRILDEIDFCSYYDNFLYAISGNKQIKWNLEVPYGYRYIIRKPVYVPDNVSINFNNSIIGITKSLNDSYAIRLNVNKNAFDKGWIDWSSSYPTGRQNISNFTITNNYLPSDCDGNYSKIILFLSSHKLNNITFRTNNYDCTYIDQYPEAGERIYLDACRLDKINANTAASSVGFIKLGYGDAGVYTQICGIKLLIVNQQGFIINGGIQCYPYIISSVGNISALHNEQPFPSYFHKSTVNLHSSVLFRKTWIEDSLLNINDADLSFIPFEITSFSMYNYVGTNLTLSNIDIYNNIQNLSLEKIKSSYDVKVTRGNYHPKIMINNCTKRTYNYGSNGFPVNLYVSSEEYITTIKNKDSFDVNNLNNMTDSGLNYGSDKIKVEGTLEPNSKYTYQLCYKVPNRNIWFTNPDKTIIVNTGNYTNALFSLLPNGNYLRLEAYLFRIKEGDDKYYFAKLNTVEDSTSTYKSTFMVLDLGEMLSNNSYWEETSITPPQEKPKVLSLKYNRTKDILSFTYGYYSTTYKAQNKQIWETYGNELHNGDEILGFNPNNIKEILHKTYKSNNINIDNSTGLPFDCNNIGTSANRPTYDVPNNFIYFDTTLNKPILYSNGQWIDANGNTPNNFPIKGTTAQRPTGVNDGYEYYDTTIRQPIYWNESRQGWINADGYAAGVRGGVTQRRTELTEYLVGLDAGLQFFDSELGKTVVWNGATWVNVDGSALE